MSCRYAVHIYLIVYIVFLALDSGAQNPVKTDSLEKKLKEVYNDRLKVDILIELANEFLVRNPDTAIVYAERALYLSEEIDYEESELTSLLILANIYSKKTDSKLSLQYALRSKYLALELDKPIEYAESLLIIGTFYYEENDYSKSSDLFFEALKKFEQNNDKAGIGKSLGKIGRMHYYQNNFDKALDYFYRSLAIAKEINDPAGIASTLNNIAAVFGIREDYDKAKSNLLESVKYSRISGSKLVEAYNAHNLGSLHRYLGNYDSALFFYDQAISINLEQNKNNDLAGVYIAKAYLYNSLGDDDKELFYANKAFKLAEKYRLRPLILDAAFYLHSYYKNKHDTVNAYIYSCIQYQMSDSLKVDESISRIAQHELLYEFEMQEQENKLRQQRKDYLYIISAGVMVFIFILIVNILVARHKIRAKNVIIAKEQLEKKLELRNKELTSNVMAIVKKNEIISDIASKLMDVHKEAVKEETKSAIKRIAGELKKTTDEEIWDEFETRFRQVYNSFYEKLLEKFPGLTPFEQRLCAFLRLNMTTKEISGLTGQRLRTLEIARSRLRKKLGIANTQENLVTFLSQI